MRSAPNSERALLPLLLSSVGALLLASVAVAQEEQQDEELEVGREEGGVTWIRMEGPLDIGMLSLLRRAIGGAQGRGDQLVVELDTPGGEIELMWTIARTLGEAHDDGIPTVAWINDRALSAGSLVAMACELIYMRDDQSVIGSALPVTFGPTGLQPVSPDPDVKEKVMAPMRSGFRAWARKHDRPEALAEAMVDPSIAVHRVRVDGEERYVTGSEWDDLRQQAAAVEHLEVVVPSGDIYAATGLEAARNGFSDGFARTPGELLDKIGCAGCEPTYVERSRSEDMASFLHMLGPVLLTLALVLGFMELKAPGFGLPGILAVACFAAFLFGRYLVGLADIPQIVLISVGLVLVAVEVFLVPGTLWAGIIGGLLVLGGIGWAFVESGFGFEHALDRRFALDSAFRMALAAAVALVVMGVFTRLLPRTPVLGRLVQSPADESDSFASALPEAADEHARVARVGAGGHALTALRPVGKVALDEAPSIEFEARSSGSEIAAEARVRVVEVQAGRLVVEAGQAQAEEREG